MRGTIISAALVAALASAHVHAASSGDSRLYAPFDPAALGAEDLDFLEAALVARGADGLAVDGTWDRTSETALVGFARTEFADTPRRLHAGALALGLIGRMDLEGWHRRHDPLLGISYALPEARMLPPEPEGGGKRRWSTDGAITVLTHRFSGDGALRWHEAARRTNAMPSAFSSYRDPDLITSSGLLPDGRVFSTRSERLGDDWPTLYVAAAPDAADTAALIVASYKTGEAETWQMEPGGELERLLDGALDLLAAIDRGLPGPNTDAAMLTPPPIETEVSRNTQATGTGFFVAPRILLTADHVTGTCTRVTLADGTALAPIASDGDLDIAVFATDRSAETWLSLAPERSARLGASVHAAGFPYFDIVGTALHLTGGNVSALSGVGDDRRFFSFTAPVQPGNSGGPLIDRDGSVLGLVVSRLSEEFIRGETGSLPQNINFALGSGEVRDFLYALGLPAGEAGLSGFDMAAGAPAQITDAVVPVLCY